MTTTNIERIKKLATMRVCPYQGAYLTEYDPTPYELGAIKNLVAFGIELLAEFDCIQVQDIDEYFAEEEND
jgi:hypothetical protein